MSQLGRIAVARRFGAPEVITIEEHEAPPLGRGQVRVAVRTGGLNPVDARRRAGTFGGQPPLVFGTEFAGVVVESQDAAWRVGAEVVGWGAQGADADLVTVVGAQLATKPDQVDWATAGGLGGVGQTAMTALKSLSLKSGDLIVVHGAAGGVGTVLVQLAVAQGLVVIGTASEANLAHLSDLGAKSVTYGPGLADRVSAASNGTAIAASIDLAGSREAGDLAAAVVRGGGAAITLVPETMTSHGIRLVQVQRSRAQMSELLDAVISGALKFPIETLPFTEIVEAHRRLDAQHARGKLVLNLVDNPHLPTSAKDA